MARSALVFLVCACWAHRQDGGLWEDRLIERLPAVAPQHLNLGVHGRVAIPRIRSDKGVSLVLRGRELGWYDMVSRPVLSEDGSVVAYSARKGERWLVAKDAERSMEYEKVGDPVLSRCGTHLAFAAFDKGEWFVVKDGRPGKAFDQILFLTFGARGNVLAYAATK